ncbi:Eco57I restriction-modification methylase domain-containing protein [Chryseobacterium schmidteae]|uniref:Eco57I restriction-modification methylase domain-containing protein n=1 Tax=Chryseobacterium schmidteae TaxID=2730404 RepID=UPI00158D5380|nr:Eco57I restriction-modification methylase domain-containing protein [Chryseobacterium schmidteae]
MINEARKYQAFYTKSTPIVDYMVSKLSLQASDKIFEPCGGDGVFIEAILRENEFAHINVCELNPMSVGILNDKFSDCPNVTIRECDTLLDDELKFNSCFGGTYDKIIANPPYGAWQDYDKRAVLKKMYPELYAKESYGLFLYRCIELLKEDGVLSFIIPDTFLNLHMHKALRNHILTTTQIVELALFSSSFFPGVNFGYANLSIITLRKKNVYKECSQNTFSVINGFSEVEQLNNIDDSNLKKYSFKQEDVLNNPDHAFLISENSNVLKLINQSKFKVGDIADCVTGFYSGNDKRFLQVISPDLKNGKNYDLVNIESINSDYKNNPEILNGIENEQYFLPIVKGGNIKYIKSENWFMDWSKKAVQYYKTDKKARFQNPKYYFRFGIGVPMISSSNITASLIENKLFDQSIVGVFPQDESLTYYLLAFFNSPTCNKLIRTINPSANNPANYIKKIPIIIPEKSVLELITKKTKKIVDEMKTSGSYNANEELMVWEVIKQIYKV